MTNKLHTGKSRRLPAEWEMNQSVMIALPHPLTDWAYMLDEIRECYLEMIKAIADDCRLLIITSDLIADSLLVAGIPDVNRANISYAAIPTNDTWIRDYGFITTVTDDGHFEINDFKFNGWGLKFAADKDNRVTSILASQSGVITGDYVNHLSFVLEGGSIESDGRGTLMTTTRCLMSANRNGGMTREEIDRYLSHSLGARKILWLDHGALMGDDTDSHIDTLARIAPDNTILYVACDDITDPHYNELSMMKRQLTEFTNADGESFQLIPLPLPSPIYDEDGMRLPATYANYLITPHSVIMPIYGQPDNDSKAMEQIALAFPDRKIRRVDCRTLIKQHGSLHCATMQTSNSVLK